MSRHFASGRDMQDAHPHSPTIQRGSSPLIRQQSQSQSQATADIDASVMRLLISTKQLLEVVTQWSRLEASEKDVSDIYVILGNEFNKVSHMFQTAGIDMTDLSKVPLDLRHILENALGEEASPRNLDKYLPRLRETIINLLTGMKRKQQVHRVNLGQAPVPPRSARKQQQQQVHTTGTPPQPGAASSPMPSGSAASENSVSPTPQPYGSHLHQYQEQPQMQQAQYARAPQRAPRTTSPTPASRSVGDAAPADHKLDLPPTPSASAHSQLSDPGTTSQVAKSGPPPPVPPPASARQQQHSRDPVSQLKESHPERRSSKRLSENYLAQLTGEHGPGRLSVDGVRRTIAKSMSGLDTIEDTADNEDGSTSRQHSPQSERRARAYSSASARQARAEPIPVVQKELTAYTLFVRQDGVTRKFVLDLPLTRDMIEAAVQKAFALETFSLLLDDDVTRTTYLLEDVADVKDRSLILVEAKETEAAEETGESPKAQELSPKEDLETVLNRALETRFSKFDDILTKMRADLETGLQSIRELPQQATTEKAVAPVNEDERMTTLQQELEALRTTHQEVLTKHAAIQKELEEHVSLKDTATKDLQSKTTRVAEMSSRQEELLKDNAKLTQRVADLEAKLTSKTREAVIGSPIQATSPRMSSAEGFGSLAVAGSAAGAVPAVLPENALDRVRVLKLSARQEQAVTTLTARIDEQLNAVQRVKKDVLQRKVSPHPQLLADLTREFDELVDGTAHLRTALAELHTQSNTLWEAELTTITTEQQALEYQSAMIDDMCADLDEWRGVLDNIKDLEVQRRALPGAEATEDGSRRASEAVAGGGPGGLPPLVGQPLVIETAGDPQKHHKFVQQDIKSLQVNSEARAAAIAEAERQRQRDKQYLVADPFAKELGAFVAGAAFKNRGLAPELERKRSERDVLVRAGTYAAEEKAEEQADTPADAPDAPPATTDHTPIAQTKDAPESVDTKKDTAVEAAEMTKTAEVASPLTSASPVTETSQADDSGNEAAEKRVSSAGALLKRISALESRRVSNPAVAASTSGPQSTSNGHGDA